ELIITKSKWKRRAWITAAVVGLVVIGLLVAAIVILTTNKSSANTVEEEAITLEDFLRGRLSSRGFNATFISDNELIYRDSDGNVVIHDVEKRDTRTILSSSNAILSAAFSFELSPDQRYLLLAHNYQKVYRYSYIAQFTVIDLETKNTYPLSVDNTTLGRIMQLAKWGPVDNALFFVHGSNIYYKSNAVSDDVVMLTTDGQFGFVHNGVPDWVYEEEVLSSNEAMWASPDGKKLAYAKFDDREVRAMTIPFYGEPGSLSSQYTQAAQIRYPKPGTTNPTVTFHVIDLENTTSVKDLTAPSAFSEPILSAVSWATNTSVAAIWLNRVQNQSSIISYNVTADTQITVASLSSTNGWLELFTAPLFSSDGSKFAIILSQDQGNGAGSYRHLTLVDTEENGAVTALTNGKFVVTEIVSWDNTQNVIYYHATTEEDPAVQHLYSVSTSSGTSTCISCEVTSINTKTECLYNSAVFSGSHSYYVLTCEGPGVPEVAVFASNKTRLDVWEDNEELVELTQEKLVPVTQRFTFPLADGFTAQVLLKLPPNMDSSGNTKYPMLVNVYGGPDSYQVVEKFSLDWGSYLAANKSIIYATIDGRGSGLKGDKYLFSNYRAIGTLEIADQINVTKQIQQNLTYVDADRTAIWGWSYGGYAAGMALATDTENIFKCGMSVAPVTDWALYDSIYTERFMGLPNETDNYEGYVNAQLINKYEGIRDKDYFLIHGTLDDNVHYQQSMLWSKILEQKDILFRQQSYTDETHSLTLVRPHLYHTLESFLDECFIVGNE
ncbi:DPP4, partial [Rhyzopertha dominica]